MHIRLLSLLFLSSFVLLTAQDDSAELNETPEPELIPEGRIVEFSVFVWPTNKILLGNSRLAGIPRTFYDSPTGVKAVHLKRNESTPLMAYQGEQPMVLFDIDETWIQPPPNAAPGTGPTVQRVRRPVIRAEIPEELDRAMIIVIPNQKAADGSTLLATVLPYEIDKLKPGMARLHNGSNQTLALQFDGSGGKLLRIEPRKAIDFTPSDFTDSKYPRVFLYVMGGDQKLKMVHTSKLFLEGDTTNFFVLYPHGKSRVRILRLGGHEEQ